MSMVYGSSLASAMIDLHADIFPYLALLATMKKKGGLAYLLSSCKFFYLELVSLNLNCLLDQNNKSCSCRDCRR